MSKKMSKLMVALLLSKKSIAQIIIDAKDYVTSMTGNVHFPGPSPALSVITTLVTTLEAAVAVAQTKLRGSVGKMHAELKALNIQLKLLAGYVESVANQDPDHAQDIIQSSGMLVKKHAQRPPKIFTAVQGKNSGDVVLNTKAVRHGAYIYQMSTDGINWTTIYTGTKVRFVKTGLTAGTHVFFRVAVSDKNGQGDYSHALSITVA